MPDISPYPQFNSLSAVVLAMAIIVAVFINLIPLLSYPFYLLFVLIHEMGHVFATRSTGGRVVGFWIFSNTTGATRPEGGYAYVMIPAGYIGVTLFSAGLILLTGLPNLAPYSLALLAIFLILFILLYSVKPANPNEARSPVTAIVGLGFAIVFIGVAWMAPLVWSMFLLTLLAIQGAFSSLQLLDELALQVRQNVPGIDPVRMTELVGCSPMFWVRVWSLLSILILGAAIWFAWLRNLPLLLSNA
jgi:hypothetical protein